MSQFVNLNLNAGRTENVFADFNIGTSGQDILDVPSEYSVGVSRFKVPLSSIPKYRFYEKEFALTMLSDSGGNTPSNTVQQGLKTLQDPTQLLSTFLDLDCLPITNYGTFGIDKENGNKKFKDIYSEQEFLDLMNITAAHAFYEFGRQQDTYVRNQLVVGGNTIPATQPQIVLGLGDTKTRRNGVVENNGYTALLNVDVPFFIEAITTALPVVGGTTLTFGANTLTNFGATGIITVMSNVAVNYAYTGKGVGNDTLTGLPIFNAASVALFPIGTRVRFGDYSSADAQLNEVAQTNSIICGFELELKSLASSIGVEDFSNFDFILERTPILNTSLSGTSDVDVARGASRDSNQLYFNNGILKGLTGALSDGYDADLQLSFGSTTKYHIEAQKMVNADVINAYRGASNGGSKLVASSAAAILLPNVSFVGNSALGKLPQTFGSLDVYNADGSLLDRITYGGTAIIDADTLQLTNVNRTNAGVLHPKWTNVFVSGSSLPTTRPRTGFSLFPTAMDVNGFLGKSYEGYNYKLRVRNKLAFATDTAAALPRYIVPSSGSFGVSILVGADDIGQVKPTLTFHTFTGRPIDVQNTNYAIQSAFPQQLGKQRTLYQTDFLAPRFLFNNDGKLGLSINSRYLADYNMSIYMNDQLSSLINFQKYKTLPVKGNTNFTAYFTNNTIDRTLIGGDIYRFAGEVGKYDADLNAVSLNSSNVYYETFTSESFRDLLNSVVITTGRLAITGEYIGDGGSTRKMLTDFETDPSSIGRNYALYYNNGGMRLYPLLSDTPIKQVDAQIFYQDIYGVLRRLIVKPNEECSIKLEFRPNVAIYSQTGAIDNFNIS